VSTASPTDSWSARRTTSHARPTRFTCVPHASASKASVNPCSRARSPTRASCSADRSRSSSASGVAFEQTSAVVAPSCSITSNFTATRRRASANRARSRPSRSRIGWNRSISRPRSVHRRATSPGRSAEAMRSLSKTSIPSNFAAEIASSFCGSVPEMETVAMPLRMTLLGGVRLWRAGRVARAAPQEVSAASRAASSVPKCARIRSASAGRPVNSSNAPTAWCTAMPPPSTTRHPRSRANRSRAVSIGK
jgi:hypothetical protein